ncbi:hypothetical protein [Methanoplanus limicola]|uniref:Uncharacterized protein n=1 Tax=Methanoplanus limicola DSM 2279 TaxID=937775 RepID=H1YX50_9EURY|nr:hypothetical protein [Methanoplanus limicola]EHQ35853.1 hypothetical protein Metlim_1752 [Methanoplanus limicola DSM 2279]
MKVLKRTDFTSNNFMMKLHIEAIYDSDCTSCEYFYTIFAVINSAGYIV